MRLIHRIILHHTASPATWTRSQVREVHLARGFSDIGYHLLVLADGTLSAGRPEGNVGAHVKGENYDSLGISLVGDFSRHPVPPVQWAAAVNAVADWCRRYRIDADHVWGHCELAPTLCPGFNPADFRRDLRAVLEV